MASFVRVTTPTWERTHAHRHLERTTATYLYRQREHSTKLRAVNAWRRAAARSAASPCAAIFHYAAWVSLQRRRTSSSAPLGREGRTACSMFSLHCLHSLQMVGTQRDMTSYSTFLTAWCNKHASYSSACPHLGQDRGATTLPARGRLAVTLYGLSSSLPASRPLLAFWAGRRHAAALHQPWHWRLCRDRHVTFLRIIREGQRACARSRCWTDVSAKPPSYPRAHALLIGGRQKHLTHAPAYACETARACAHAGGKKKKTT